MFMNKVKLKPREKAIADTIVYKHICVRDVSSLESVRYSARLGRQSLPSWYHKVVAIIIDHIDPDAVFNDWYYGGTKHDKGYLRNKPDALELGRNSLYKSIQFKSSLSNTEVFNKLREHTKKLISVCVHWCDVKEDGYIELAKNIYSHKTFLSFPQDRRRASSLLGSSSDSMQSSKP